MSVYPPGIPPDNIDERVEVRSYLISNQALVRQLGEEAKQARIELNALLTKSAMLETKIAILETTIKRAEEDSLEARTNSRNNRGLLIAAVAAAVFQAITPYIHIGTSPYNATPTKTR